MIPLHPDFKKLEIGDKDELVGALALFGAGICEHSFSNLYIWKDFDRPSVAKLGEIYLIRIEPMDEAPFFLEPIGGNERFQSFGVCFENGGKISRASPSFISDLQRDGYNVSSLRDHYDYIYKVSDLAALKGRIYDGKRNHIKKFVETYPNYEYVPLGKNDADEVMNVFEEWNSAQEYLYVPPDLRKIAADSQRDALVRAFEASCELSMHMGGIRVSGRLVSFAMGSPHPGVGSIDLHFLYSVPGVRGLMQTLIWEACRKTFDDFHLINFEQDLGILGLRRMKESYHPHMVEKKFEICRGSRGPNNA